MSNVTKQDILDEIRRTAKENGGVPLGTDRLAKETGITKRDVYKFWACFSEAQCEAGFEPNKLTVAYSNEFLIESIITLMREIGRFPTCADLIGKRHRDPKFPDSMAFSRLGSKKERAEKVSGYAEQKGDNDIVKMCASVIESSKGEEADNVGLGQVLGEVYLFKSGRYYKIGKTNDTVRRGQELRIQLPEKVHLIHSIKTDDPSGIEAYWHRRFESKRGRGEWFELSPADVKAFKRWKRIV